MKEKLISEIEFLDAKESENGLSSMECLRRKVVKCELQELCLKKK